MRPDEYFTVGQQKRLTELLAKRHAAHDVGHTMDACEEAELEALVAAELDVAARRAEALIGELRP